MVVVLKSGVQVGEMVRLGMVLLDDVVEALAEELLATLLVGLVVVDVVSGSTVDESSDETSFSSPPFLGIAEVSVLRLIRRR